MGSRHIHAINGMTFAFFGTCSHVIDCDWRKNFFKKEIVFHFVVMTCLSDKAIRAITAKQHIRRYLVLERNIQNLAARLALKTFLTAFIILFPCMDIDKLLL